MHANLLDFLLLPIYSTLLLAGALIIQEFWYGRMPYKNYLVLGLSFKLLGAMLFCAVYTLYYAGGDTTLYYNGAMIISEQIRQNPKLGWQLMGLSAGEYSAITAEFTSQFSEYFRGENTLGVIKLTVLLSFISFNSFWVISLLFATLSFTGLWAFYMVLVDMYPKLYRQMAVAAFFVPSVFFWGSGIMKDTMTIGALGWLVYGVYRGVIAPKNRWFALIMGALALKIIIVIKAYIAVAFLPAAVLWIVGHFRSRLVDWRLDRFISISIGSVLLIGGVIYRGSLQSLWNKAFVAFARMSFSFQSWHDFLANERGQTGYTLGKVDFTLWGILSKLPESIVVALFRPFLYEVRSPIMLITALESTALLVGTLYIWWKVGFFRSFRIAWLVPEIRAFLFFALFFAFIVGFTSYNFGALARYKIPCLPFYICSLYWIYEHHRRSLVSPSVG